MSDLFSRVKNIINKDKNNHLTIMHDEAIRNQAEIIVECGVDRGTSTYAFLLASEKINCKLFSFDIKDCSKIINHENWSFLKSNDLDLNKILNEFPEIKTKGIDLLYIDSYHEPNHVKKLLEKYAPLINLNGIIFVDDTSSLPFRRKKILTDSINADLCKEAVEEFYFSNYEYLDYQFNGAESGLSSLRKIRNFQVNYNQMWKYNSLVYFFFKIIKKIKYNFLNKFKYL